MKTRTLTVLSAFGLFAAATAWAVHQQVNEIFASLACTHGMILMWIVTILALLTLGAAGGVTFGLMSGGATTGISDVQRPRRFMTSVSLLAVLLFLFAILLQASATLFLPSCA